MKLRLWVEAVGADDMDLFVAIQKLDPEGTLVTFPFYAEHDDGNVALGWLRASHRELDEERSTPGATVASAPPAAAARARRAGRARHRDLAVGTRFERGDTLRLIVCGRDVYDYPGAIISRHEETLNAGTHVLHMGGALRLAPARAAAPAARLSARGGVRRRVTRRCSASTSSSWPAVARHHQLGQLLERGLVHRLVDA